MKKKGDGGLFDQPRNAASVIRARRVEEKKGSCVGKLTDSIFITEKGRSFRRKRQVESSIGDKKKRKKGEMKALNSSFRFERGGDPLFFRYEGERREKKKGGKTPKYKVRFYSSAFEREKSKRQDRACPFFPVYNKKGRNLFLIIFYGGFKENKRLAARLLGESKKEEGKEKWPEDNLLICHRAAGGGGKTVVFDDFFAARNI